MTSPNEAHTLLGALLAEAGVPAQRRSERRLAQVIDALTAFVGLCLPDGTLVQVNRAALASAGVEAADVVGRPLWETSWWSWHPDVSDRVRAAVARARAGETVRYDDDTMTAEGTVTMDVQLVPVIEDGEVVAIVPSATDVSARRRSVEQASGLAALARRLNAASTAGEVAEVIRVHSTAVIGGRHATLALVEPAERIIRLIQSPNLPQPVANEYRTLPLDSPNHVARCLRTGTPVVLADPLALDDVGGSPEELERLRSARGAAGVTVSAAAPLVDSTGAVFGVLAMGWPRIGDLDEERRARLDTVAELCAQAVERARLSDAHAAAAERGRALSAVAQELASAVTVDAVWDAVSRAAPAVVGAHGVALGLLDPSGTALDVRYPSEVAARVPRLRYRQPLATRRPQSDAARTGEAVFLANPAEYEERYPGLLGEIGASTTSATAVLPLRDNADRVTGTIAFGWTTPPLFDPLLRSTLDTLAELCGQTLERVGLHAAEHELVEGLQRRLLPPIPRVPGVAVHATYRAAQTAVGIGGDFHLGIVLPGGRLAVVLGDVAGHGMEAAADMAQLRTLISTLLATGTPLERLFPQADAALRQLGALSLATAAAAVIDPVAHTLSYLHAGHPPLVLRTPDGETAPLCEGRGGLLGVGIAGGDPVSVPFEPGSVLVGYTDGLVERRGESLDEGIGVLVAATARACSNGGGKDLDPARIASAVLDDCVGDYRLTDDVALVVVTRRRGPGRRRGA